MKTEQWKTAIRLLDEKLAKKDNELTPTAVESPEEQHEGQRRMGELEEEQWGMHLPPAAAEHHLSDELVRHRNYLEQEPNAHHLERQRPHPDHKEKPWEVYELGMGEAPGRSINQGMPMNSSELLQAIEGNRMDTHRAVIRPSNKTEPWLRLKGHPNFKHAVQRHLADLYNKTIRSDMDLPVSGIENYHHKELSQMNPQELAMIQGKKR
jgi:hypothetical protein